MNSSQGVPLYVLEDRLFRVVNWEEKTKEDFSSKFCKRRGKIASFSPEKTEDRFLLKISQVLSQTNWKIWILSQKNRKIFTGRGTPIFCVFRQNKDQLHPRFDLLIWLAYILNIQKSKFSNT